MRKRLWMFIGILAGMVLYTLLTPVWNGLFGGVAMPFITMLISGGALTAMIGFVYLHVPEAKRSVRSGSIIGSINRLLAGAFRVHDAGPGGEEALFILLRIILIGTVCGGALALCELRWNPNRKPAVQRNETD